MTELIVVMAIIGILMAFILQAMWGGIRVAEEKATIALIAKLEQAVTDRVDALTNSQATPTPAHRTMAALHNSGVVKPIESPARAQVIAQIDAMRSNLPDVFVVHSTKPPAAGYYPLNFAAAAFGFKGNATDYMLPLGANAGGVPLTGMYGASFEAAGGIYKQVGYGPKGFDGNDNNHDGYVDDFLEGSLDLSPEEILAIRLRLNRHKHKTARSEMLYALLVEAGGPQGSAFTKEEFTSKEVQDTDGDGLLEFVDAWGEPLQFYRWPILYRSDTQTGFPDLAKLTADLKAGRTPGPYSSVYETREQNPLDPNQTLMAPAWWGSDFNDEVPGTYGHANGKISAAAMFFMAHFVTLVDPMAASGKIASNTTFWDRSTMTDKGYYQRRAYYSRFLILSSGPDRIAGVARLSALEDYIDYRVLDERSSFPLANGEDSRKRDGSGTPVPANVTNVLRIENQGGLVDPNRSGVFLSVPFGANSRNDTSTFLESAGHDDITSQMLQATGGSLR